MNLNVINTHIKGESRLWASIMTPMPIQFFLEFAIYSGPSWSLFIIITSDMWPLTKCRKQTSSVSSASGHSYARTPRTSKNSTSWNCSRPVQSSDLRTSLNWKINQGTRGTSSLEVRAPHQNCDTWGKL